MKKKIIYVVLYSLLLAAVAAAETLAIVRVMRLNMIPDLYLGLLIGAFVLMLGLLGVLLFVHKKGKRVGIARQIIAGVLALVTIAGCLFVSPKVQQLQTTVENIVVEEPVKPTRNIYVQMGDPAQTIADTAGYTFAALLQDQYCADQVAKTLETELGTEVKVEYFESESVMIVSYYNNEVNALILSEGQLSILLDNELYADFFEKNRVLYTTFVTENENPDAVVQSPEPEVEQVADITNTPFIVYLSGMDSYGETLKRTRSDVNILMVVNPTTKQILLVNTPRDYYIVHPWGSGSRDKLTHCGVYGIDCSIKALEILYDVPVNYYMQINFSGFERLIDAIGGITVYSDHAFDCGDYFEVSIREGENTLNGYEALSFARDRKHQAGGDNDRGKNQMKVIKAVIGKVSSASTVIAKYSAILSSLEGMIATNVPIEDINKLVKMQLTDMAEWNIQTYAVTGYGDTQPTYSMPSTPAYVMRPNQSTVNHAKDLITRVINGEILTEADVS